MLICACFNNINNILIAYLSSILFDFMFIAKIDNQMLK